MKLIACFTVFDGLELLDKAILNIIPHVDEVIICWQDVSNKGNFDPNVGEFLQRYEQHSDVFAYKYATDLKLGPKENERRKHNLMLEKARQHGATHFLMAATDHFYDAGEFFRAKHAIIANDWDMTMTAMFTYYKWPTWRLTPIENYYMPFICKIYPNTKIERIKNYPVLVDPSVQVNTWEKWHLFPAEEIMLHHFSMIRTDIKWKFLNAASPWTPDDVRRYTAEFENYNMAANTGVAYFQGRKIEVVPDQFNLSTIFVP